MSIDLTCKIDGRLVRPGGTERFVLVKLRAEQVQRQERAPLNLSLILDRSGSMAGRKLDLVKRAASFVIERLAERDRVSVVLYDDEVRVAAASDRATPAHQKAILKALREVCEGGSTNLSGGWLAGCRQLADYQQTDRYVDCAWLLTDGLANMGITSDEELTRHASELRKRGLSTTTFGVGHDFNESLLRGMAEKGGGHFYYIEHSNQIPDYFAGELGERFGAVARAVYLRLQLPDGTVAECLNGYESSLRGSTFSVFIGDMHAGETKEIVLKVTFPASSPGLTRRVGVFLDFITALTGEGREVKFPDPVEFEWASDAACDAQPRDPEVNKAVGLAYAARARDEMVERNRRGDYAGVDQAGSDLNRYLESADLLTVAQEDADLKDYLTETQTIQSQASAAPMSAPLAKKVQYGTYRTRQSRQDYGKDPNQT